MSTALCGKRVRLAVELSAETMKRECPNCMAEATRRRLFWRNCLPLMVWNLGGQQHYGATG